MRRDLEISIQMCHLDELLCLAASKTLSEPTIRVVSVFTLVKKFWVPMSQASRLKIIRDLEHAASVSPDSEILLQILDELKSIRIF